MSVFAFAVVCFFFTGDYYMKKYGPVWRTFSRDFKLGRRKCMWCNNDRTNNLACHHVGCVQYNPDHVYDERIIIIVCRSCHLLLEPWSKINLTQVLPQLYEIAAQPPERGAL